MMAISSQLRYDSLASKFKYELKQAILSAPNENFDILSTRIKIVESDNKKLTIYSWDDGSGGSWHSMTVLVKFTTKKHKVKVIEIGGNEIETSAFTDAIIYELHELKLSKYLRLKMEIWLTVKVVLNLMIT